MNILISGSMAYDRIMEIPGRFSDHILPDKIHLLNVSFAVNNMMEKFGGTAGNIAYALSLLAEQPRILSTVGQDYQRYFQWLDELGLATGDIRVIPEEFTASAYITTDTAQNQITIFNPGAMNHVSACDLTRVDPAECIAIVAPGNLQDMAGYARAYHERGIFFIFDPGQSLPAWEGDDLARSILSSKMLVSNDYELELIKDKTGLSAGQILGNVDTIVTTKAELGCEVITRNGAVQIPAVATDKVADPTGAGDAFRGGLIKGLVQGYSVEWAAKMGTVCAHYAVQAHGTQEYSFTPKEFQAMLESNFSPSSR